MQQVACAEVDVGVQVLAAEIVAAGGIMTAQDLVDAQPTVKQPITAQVTTPLHTLPVVSACASPYSCSIFALGRGLLTRIAAI